MRKKVILTVAVLLAVVTLFCTFSGNTVADFMQIDSKDQVEQVELYPYLSFCGVGFQTQKVTEDKIGQALIKLLFDTRVHIEPIEYSYYSGTETRSSVHMAVTFEDLSEEHPYCPSAFLSFFDDETVVIDLTTADEYQPVQYQFKLPPFSPISYTAVKEALRKTR